MAEKQISIIKVSKCLKCDSCMFDEYKKITCKDGKTGFRIGHSTKRLFDLINSCPGKVMLGVKTKEHRQNSGR